jgi:hypothetical protein
MKEKVVLPGDRRWAMGDGFTSHLTHIRFSLRLKCILIGINHTLSRQTSNSRQRTAPAECKDGGYSVVLSQGKSSYRTAAE